jgi:hypothetical protein
LIQYYTTTAFRVSELLKKPARYLLKSTYIGYNTSERNRKDNGQEAWGSTAEED